MPGRSNISDSVAAHNTCSLGRNPAADHSTDSLNTMTALAPSSQPQSATAADVHLLHQTFARSDYNSHSLHLVPVWPSWGIGIGAFGAAAHPVSADKRQLVVALLRVVAAVAVAGARSMQTLRFVIGPGQRPCSV